MVDSFYNKFHQGYTLDQLEGAVLAQNCMTPQTDIDRIIMFLLIGENCTEVTNQEFDFSMVQSHSLFFYIVIFTKKLQSYIHQVACLDIGPRQATSAVKLVNCFPCAGE